MRPAPLLIALVLACAGLTVGLLAFVRDPSVPLLVVWGGLVTICILDLLVSTGSRNLVTEFELPETGYTGANALSRLTVTARKGHLPPRIDIRPTADASLETDWSGPVMTGSRLREIILEKPVALLERGTHAVSRIALKFASRLRLFEIISNRDVKREITVLPNINPILSGDIQTRMLPLMDGLKDMNLRGEGSEFHQLREFVTGMDPRSIDWKRSARMRQLTARETRAERNHQIIVAVDSGHLMGERIGGLAKLDHAINAALALTWAGGLGGDLVGFYNFSSRPQQFIPARPGRQAFPRIQGVCAGLQQDSAETNHTLGLTFLNGKLARRSLIIIFSDFVDSITAELLVENIGVMARHHLVLYVAMRDPSLGTVINPETVTFDSMARSVSSRRILQERQIVLDRLKRLGVLCLDADPSELTPSLISRYIDIKAGELI